LPEGDEVTLDLSAASGTLTAEWMHPVEGTIVYGGKVGGGARVNFAAPFSAAAVLYVNKR
jgi:hypothetical protein